MTKKIIVVLVAYMFVLLFSVNCIAEERFKNNQDGTVTDSFTGLMWKRCSEGQIGVDMTGEAIMVEWKDAIKIPDKLNRTGYAGYKDWRLPSIDDLNTLINKNDQAFNNAVAKALPTSNNEYWSSSSDGGNYALYASFNRMEPFSAPKSNKFFVRLVRNIR